VGQQAPKGQRTKTALLVSHEDLIAKTGPGGFGQNKRQGKQRETSMESGTEAASFQKWAD